MDMIEGQQSEANKRPPVMGEGEPPVPTTRRIFLSVAELASLKDMPDDLLPGETMGERRLRIRSGSQPEA